MTWELEPTKLRTASNDVHISWFLVVENRVIIFVRCKLCSFKLEKEETSKRASKQKKKEKKKQQEEANEQKETAEAETTLRSSCWQNDFLFYSFCINET